MVHKGEILKVADTHTDVWRYVCVDGHWDEASLPSGHPRRHWRELAVAIGRMRREELHRSWQTGQQLVQANGASFNVGDGLRREERSWPLDPIPLVISADEWADIERAIIQRATLLNAVLADVYGPMRLLHDRQMPPALLFSNPAFLRPCHGAHPRAGVYLHSYAADLARGPDGRWCVTADRTQAPSGLGYTLENRVVSARTMCNLFSSCRVRQLARFFEIKREALLRVAAGRQTTPRIVLLTSGPHSETYFEHSFLAGHWGFPIVEGADLAMRDNRVFLKTVGGLQPVDLIVRRLDDSFCDPLELRADSVIGVPGLLQAVRSGTVAIDNALGSGLLEAQGYMAVLPGLCRHMLGEDLRIAPIRTWWCGQEQSRHYVLDHLNELVITPTFSRTRHDIEIPASMDSAARQNLITRIQARPDNFAAQKMIPLSTAPVYTGAGIEARHLVLRVFATWNGDSYTVLPGGLTRVSPQKVSPAVSLHLGGGDKGHMDCRWRMGRAGYNTFSTSRSLCPPELD